jgi:hypothetical protein
MVLPKLTLIAFPPEKTKPDSAPTRGASSSFCSSLRFDPGPTQAA